MVEIISQDGHFIRNLDDWLRHGGPARKEEQWVDGRSAKELAKAWIGPIVPAELTRLMESHEVTRGFVFERAIPERETPLANDRVSCP